MLKRCAIGVCALAGAFVAEAAQQGTMVGGEYVMSVPSGDVTLNTDDIAALGTGVSLVKQGEGRLVIASDLVGWTGELRIEAGYVRAQHVGAMGYALDTATRGGVVVKSGGTLEIDGAQLPSGGSKTYAQCHRYFLEGTGVGGTAGAIRLINASSYWCGSPIVVVLTGDTTFTADSAARQLDIRYAPKYDMGGHTLTLDGIRFCVCNGDVKNPGNYVVKNGGTFVSEQTNYGNGSKGNTVSFADGTAMRVTRVVDGYNWYGLDFAGSSTWYTQSWSDDILNPRNVMNGPVNLGGTARVQFQNSTVSAPYASGTEHNTLELKGKVSGVGGFNVVDGWLLLSNAENDFSGPTTVEGANAHIVAKDWYALPSATNGQLLVKNGASVDITLDPEKHSPSAKLDGELGAFFKKMGSSVQNGTLNLNIAGTYTYTTPTDEMFGPISLTSGTLEFSNCGMLQQGGQTNWIAGVWPALPRVVVGEGAAFGNLVETPINESANMSLNDKRFWIIGRTATRAVANMRGILEVKAGGVVTNRIESSSASLNPDVNSSTTVFIRKGGCVVNPYQSNSSTFIGSFNQGYVELEDGGYWKMGSEWVRFGANATGYGVFWQKGGTVEHPGQHITPGWSGGHGRIRISKGTLTASRGMMIVCTLWGSNANAGDAVFTVENAEVTLEDKCVMAANTGASAVLNLNGGVFRPYSIDKATNVWNSLSCNYTTITSNYGVAGIPYSNNRADVNFNGGTLRAMYNGCLFGSLDGKSTKPDRVTAYAGGAVVDTINKSVQLNLPLEAPSGKGISQIPFSCATPWNYTGSPVVTIVGDGTGASAFAEFDSTNGTITGVVVTSPGNDYTTAKAVIARGGWTNTVEIPLTSYLVDNVTTGGLTKVGSGDLELTAVNTYKGATVVREGTLRLGVDNAINTASLLRVEAGATADLNGKTLTVSGLAGAGTVTGNLTIAGVWHVAASDLLAGRSLKVNGTVTLAPGTSIHVDDPDGLLESKSSRRTYTLFRATTVVGGPSIVVDNLEKPWSAGVNGSAVQFGYQQGTIVIFR